jgi:flagellar biosynthesis/type III secretory pathway protein FliH
MRDGFIPLARWLAPSAAFDEASGARSDTTMEIETAPQAESSVDELGVAVSEVRRFRAALSDALDVSLGELLREIALDVVGRELALEPCNIERIVERARERYRVEEPLRIRVHVSDLARLSASYREIAIADDSLRAGDVMLCVRNGTIEASLAARLERLLRELPE